MYSSGDDDNAAILPHLDWCKPWCCCIVEDEHAAAESRTMLASPPRASKHDAGAPLTAQAQDRQQRGGNGGR